MSFDTSKIERIGPDYWRNSQLSIARFYGGITLQGAHYTLDPATDYLVRDDIFKAEQKAKKKEKKATVAQEKLF